jgi:spore germination protein KA
MYTPYLFSDNFSSLDDYDNPTFYSSFIRLLKYFSFILSLFLPGIYVAIGTFHQEVIPTTLLYVVAASESTTPFPLVVEAIFIHILYEIMREAGLRLPKTIGHAVSIIGAIVIGEATVSAGLIGAPMLVVVAVTAIASYVVYPLYESVAVLRIVFIVIGGTMGIYGIMLGAGMLFVNICALNAYGVPYSAPLSPLTKNSIGDTILRESWLKLSKRKVRVSELEGSAIDEK